MNRLFGFFLGTKRYSVKCSSPSRICGRLMAHFPESVYNARVNEESCFEFSCLCTTAKKAEAFLDSYDCEKKELGIYGMPRYLKSLVGKPGLVLGLTFIIACAIYRNSVVWDIEISGNRKIGDREIINTLAELNFAVGRPYSKDELSAICNSFILKDDRFTRIAVNMSGNFAFVEVTERTKKADNEKIPSKTGVLSAYDCIIERPEVVSGTSVVKAGQIVKKGALLISPFEKGNDGLDYITGAKGKIYARTVEYFEVSVPHEIRNTVYDGTSHKSYSVSFLGTKIKLPELLDGLTEDYICNVETEKLRLSENLVLPFKLKTMLKRPYTVELHTLTLSEAEEKAYEIMYEKIARDLAECEILSTEFALAEKEGYSVLTCVVECIRDVASYKE